tara:strand:+ start:593 stop:772 length:180 start_codon:yes stop_codon:yes gene_type:complete
MNKDLNDLIARYESGTMDTTEDLIEFFQRIIDTGLVWQLNAHYGKTAKALIEQGYCRKK